MTTNETTEENPLSITTPARRWYALDRVEDVSGVSGTGRVAYVLPLVGAGIITVWDTSFVDEDGVRRHSHGSDYLPDFSMLRAIKCHGGKTLLTPLDEDEIATERAEELLADARNRWETVLLVLHSTDEGQGQ